MNDRKRQMDRMRHPNSVPVYNRSKGIWKVYIDGRLEDGDVLYVSCEFAGAGLIYPFHTKQSRKDGWHDHEHGFSAVLGALLEDECPEEYSVEGFEEYYSKQELEMLRKVQEKLLAMKKTEKV